MDLVYEGGPTHCVRNALGGWLKSAFKPPMGVKAFKRTLQEMPGIGGWYGTMPKECMIAWVIETTGPNEVRKPPRR
jgi:hypothetical protein